MRTGAEFAGSLARCHKTNAKVATERRAGNRTKCLPRALGAKVTWLHQVETMQLSLNPTQEGIKMSK